MKCPKCQFENREGAKFCLECGQRFDKPCPECNKDLPLSAKFCDECGHKFGEAIVKVLIDCSKPKSYTPKHLADKILTTRSSLEGERKIVTVLFADVANYTAMSEKLDPEEVLQILGGAFKIMMDETHKYEGTINQFTGDGVMAIFGAPVAHENHAQRSCYTALSIQHAMADYSAGVEKKYGIDFKIRIGLNSGPVIVSAIGDDLRMDYTAVGDTTNLAARMENMAKPGAIFVSANTHKIVERYFEFDLVGKAEVKGKEQPQDIYELKNAGDVVTRIDASIAKGLTRFVGRKNSMASLMEVYDKVKSGSGQMVGIVGEAGVGKSRLILEFKNRIIYDSHAVLEGQCLQYGGSILYKPILDILKFHFDIKNSDREHIIKRKIRDKITSCKDLEHTLSSFQDLLPVQVDDEAFLKLDPRQKREKTFEAIRDLLIYISQGKPLIVVVEDLHWIDDSSEDFLDYLIEWIANTPIMLILLYRTEYQHKWSSKTYYHKINVGHLQEESSIELVKAMLEDGDITPELRDLILSRTAGNPLFMEEFTQSLIESGTIKKQDNKYVLSRKITEIKVPDTVQGIIAARMDRLEENLKRTMQVASVIGRDFAFRILQTITGMQEELKSYLRNLQGLEFIYKKRLFPELEYIFKHALTQEVAYNSLLLKRRKQIHENIGKAIEELYSERLEEYYEMLAYHYSRSDNIEKAVQYFKMSGIKAFSNYANQESYNFYNEAIGLLISLPDSEENKNQMIEIGKLMYAPMTWLGFPEGSLEILQNGERLSKEIEDKKCLSAFYFYISTYFLYKGNPLDGIKYVKPRFDDARNNQDIDLMAPLSIALCISMNDNGYFNKTLEFLPQVISLLEKTNKQNEFFDTPFYVYRLLCNHCGGSLVAIGHFEKAKLFLEKGIALAVANNDQVNIGLYHLYYSNLYSFKGDNRKSIEHSQNSLKISEEIHLPFMVAVSQLYLGGGYYGLGELDAARKHFEKGYDSQREISVSWVISLYPAYLSQVHLDLADMAKAQRYAEEALELSIKGNSLSAEGLSRIFLGRILGKSKISKPDEPKRYILQGIKILKELKLRPWISRGHSWLGDLYADIGEYDKAVEWLKRAEGEFQDMGMDYDLSFSKSLIGNTLFKIDPSQFSASEQIIFDAIRIAENIDSKPGLAMGHLCLGEIYADHGQKEEALENLKKAEWMYQGMKMGLWIEKTREILERL